MDIWEKIKYEFNKGDSAVKQIIIVNLAVFIFTILVGVVATVSGFQSNDLLKYFAVPSDIGTLLMRPWSLVTNIFFHSGFWHLLGNMMLLFFLGRILEEFLSTKQVWHIFIFGGLSGVVLFVTGYNLLPVFVDVVSEADLRGASGGVTAIIVATGVFLPRYQIRPFNLFNIEMRWVALLFVFRDLYSFPNMQNLGGIIAHLGGALFGALYILDLQGKIELPTFSWNTGKSANMKKVVLDEKEIKTQKKSTQKAKPNQDEVDAILDKISRSGYDSLSKTEKEILFKASE